MITVFPTLTRSFTRAASQLAADPRVRIVAVIGASTGTREEIRRDLAPLGTRLAFFEPALAPAGILRALKGGRR